MAIAVAEDEAWITAAAARQVWIELGFSDSYAFTSPEYAALVACGTDMSVPHPRADEGMLEYAKEAKAAARDTCAVCMSIIGGKQTADEVCVQRWPQCDHGRSLCAPCHLTCICTAMMENHVLLQVDHVFQFALTDPNYGNGDCYKCSSCRQVVVDREGFNAHARGQEFKDLMACDHDCRLVMVNYAHESAAAAHALAEHMVPIDVDEEL